MSSRTVRSWSAQAAAARIVVQVVVREVIQGGGRDVERGVALSRGIPLWAEVRIMPRRGGWL